MEVHPAEQYYDAENIGITMAVGMYGYTIHAVVNTGTNLSTISPLLGQRCRERGAFLSHGEAEIRVSNVGLDVPRFHSPYTIDAQMTMKGQNYQHPLIVLTTQSTPFILGRDLLALTGFRLFISNRLKAPPTPQERSIRYRRAQWRNADEGLGESSEEDDD